MKIRSVGTELPHADGQTNRQSDRTKLTVTFRNFARAPDTLPDTQNRSVRDISCSAVQRSYTTVKWEDEVTFW